MHSSVWHSQYYKHIFKSVLIGTCTVLLIGLTVMYSAFFKLTLRQFEKVNRHYMETTFSSIQRARERSYNSALNAYTSTDGQMMMASHLPSPVEQLRSLRNISYILSQDPLLHSVYFFNPRTNQIYTFVSDIQQSEPSLFYDQDFVQMLDSQCESSCSGIPRKVPDSRYSDHSTPVDTTIFKMPNGEAVAVNLSLSKMFQSLEPDSAVYNGAAYTHCIFYNMQDCIYSSNLPKSTNGDFKALLKDTLQENEWDNSFSTKINGSRFQVNVVQQPDFNYQIVSIIPKNDIISSFLHYSVIFVIISILGGILALVINMRISAKLYSPIDDLTQSLPDSPKADSENNPQDYNEIDYIKKSIVQTTSQLSSLFEYKQQHLANNQATIIREQLMYNRYSDDEFWQHCTAQEIPCHPGDFFLLAYARWDHIDDEPVSPDDSRMLCYAISNVFHELIGEDACVQDIPFEDNTVVFWCSLSSSLESDKILEILKGVQDLFFKYFNLRLSFAYSSDLHEPSELYPTLQQLQDLMQYQYFYNEGHIFSLKESDLTSKNLELPPLPDMSTIESALRSADTETCSRLADQYFLELSSYSFESAQASINMLASRLIAILKRIQQNQPGFPEIDHRAFYAAVTNSPTVFHVRHLIDDLLKKILEYQTQANSDSGARIIDEVIQFLDRNYQDFNVSSKSIALECHISVPYLNRLFKQKTGETLAAYLKHLRLEKARQFLVDTNLSVETIARKVGFENTKYFYTLFKNEYGISPSNYRISHSTLELPSQS